MPECWGKVEKGSEGGDLLRAEMQGVEECEKGEG